MCLVRYHKRFFKKDKHGDLFTPGDKRRTKFCSLCAYDLVGTPRELDKHFRKQHTELYEAGEKAEWLKHGEKPKEDLHYVNWYKWLLDPKNVILMFKEPVRTGRPRQYEQGKERKGVPAKKINEPQVPSIGKNAQREPAALRGSRVQRAIGQRTKRASPQQEQRILKRARVSSAELEQDVLKSTQLPSARRCATE